MTKRFDMHKLFNSNKFVLIFSFVLAFGIWLGFSIYGGEEIQQTFEVPVQFDSMGVPGEFNLQAFGQYDTTVRVVVRGRKAVVGNLKSEDFTAIASTQAVNTVGKHTLPITVSAVRSSSDFEILSHFPLYMEALFDNAAEITMDLEPRILGDEIVGSEYIQGQTVLSATSVTASGPATEIEKITRIIARVVVNAPLTTTKTEIAEILALDEYGNEVQNITIEGGDNVQLTIPVLKVKTLPVTVGFTNIPSGMDGSTFNPQYSVTQLEVAAEESVIDELDELVIGSIDFNQITPTNNEFEFNLEELAGKVILDDVKTVKVTLDVSALDAKTLPLSTDRVTIHNPTKWTVDAINITQSSSVQVVGVRSALAAVTIENMSANLTIVEEDAQEGVQTMDLQVTLTNAGRCWIVGTYRVVITLSK